MNASMTADIVVLGGGPAGAAIASRLAVLGHMVVLIDRPRQYVHRLCESLPASIMPLLGQIGVRQAVESAGFLRAARTRIRWLAADERLSEPDEGGLLVDRDRFDAILRDAARSEGVRLLRAARVGRAERTELCWRVPVTDASGERVVEACWLVNATGVCDGDATGVATAAIVSRWEGVPLAGETLVEAFDDGWGWVAPHPDNSVHCALFVDAHVCAGLGRAGRATTCRSLLGMSSMLSTLLAGSMIGDASMRNATAWMHPDPVGVRIVRVGDAAARIDPLSSQGVQAALHSALAAAAAVHTSLACPDRVGIAADFYRRRQHEHAERHARMAQAYYDARFRQTPMTFWRARSSSGKAATQIEPWRDVQAPHHATRLRLAHDVRIVRVPVLDGDLITEAEALDHPSLERPLAFLGGRAVVPWLRTLGGMNLRAVIDKIDPQIPIEWQHGTTSWLQSRRLLVPA